MRCWIILIFIYFIYYSPSPTGRCSKLQNQSKLELWPRSIWSWKEDQVLKKSNQLTIVSVLIFILICKIMFWMIRHPELLPISKAICKWILDLIFICSMYILKCQVSPGCLTLLTTKYLTSLICRLSFKLTSFLTFYFYQYRNCHFKVVFLFNIPRYFVFIFIF